MIKKYSFTVNKLFTVTVVLGGFIVNDIKVVEWADNLHYENAWYRFIYPKQFIKNLAFTYVKKVLKREHPDNDLLLTADEFFNTISYMSTNVRNQYNVKEWIHNTEIDQLLAFSYRIQLRTIEEKLKILKRSIGILRNAGMKVKDEWVLEYPLSLEDIMKATMALLGTEGAIASVLL